MVWTRSDAAVPSRSRAGGTEYAANMICMALFLPLALESSANDSSAEVDDQWERNLPIEAEAK